MNDFIRRSINQVITSAMSVNPSAFSALNDRLLKAGKVPHSDLASLGKSSTISKGNAILEAQRNSSLYDASKLAADPLIAEKKLQVKTAGKGWFDIEPMKIDSKLKADMRMIQMRNYMDPKRFYKNPDKFTKILHTGTVIEGPAEYKSARLTNRERKQTLVEEILADKKIKDYSKRKFMEIQSEKTNKRKAYKSAKKGKK